MDAGESQFLPQANCGWEWSFNASIHQGYGSCHPTGGGAVYGAARAISCGASQGASHAYYARGFGSEPEVLPRHKRRGWQLNGEIASTQAKHRTTYMRRDYGQAEVELLTMMANAQREFTFAEVMDWKTRQRERQ